jgi:hypothetical protein
MVIVAGHITVEPQQRESYLAGCVRIVEQARRVVSCLDVAICADLVDPGRVNIFECWESRRRWRPAAAAALTRNGAGDAHGVRSGVHIADVWPLFREGGRVNLQHGARLDR